MAIQLVQLATFLTRDDTKWIKCPFLNGARLIVDWYNALNCVAQFIYRPKGKEANLWLNMTVYDSNNKQRLSNFV